MITYSINAHPVIALMFSQTGTDVLPRRDEGSDKPSATIEPHRIMVPTRTRTQAAGLKVRCRYHYTTSASGPLAKPNHLSTIERWLGGWVQIGIHGGWNTRARVTLNHINRFFSSTFSCWTRSHKYISFGVWRQREQLYRFDILLALSARSYEPWYGLISMADKQPLSSSPFILKS